MPETGNNLPDPPEAGLGGSSRASMIRAVRLAGELGMSALTTALTQYIDAHGGGERLAVQPRVFAYVWCCP
jgi:hypothetical protein